MMNNFWRSNKAFRDLVELMFVSEYELYKPIHQRSAKARAANDGDTLIGLLTVDLEACDKNRFLGIINKSVSPSDINSFIGHVRFKSFEALADEDMIPGTRASLRPQLSIYRQAAEKAPLSPVAGLLCRDTPAAYGFVQIHVENADQSTTIPIYISPLVISGSIHGAGLKDIAQEFGDVRSGTSKLPYPTQTLLECVYIFFTHTGVDSRTSHLNQAVAHDKHNKFKLRARMSTQDLLRFMTTLGEELPEPDPGHIDRLVEQARVEGLRVNWTTMSP